MEEFHLPSHLIKNIDKLGNYKYKYRHNTLIAFDEDAIKVLSHSMTLLEPTEAPSIEFSREIEYYPSKKIDDAFIFRSGVYSINNTASRTYFGKRKYSSNISLFQMDCIDKETKINFDAQIICHVDTTSSTKDDLLIILTDENDLYFYNISIDMTIYKKNISAYLNNEALNSVDMFVADYKDILGVHLNKKTLILFNLNEIENSLVVDSFNNKIIAINMILHTNSIIITIQNIYENEVQIQFNILKMFNDSEQLSVCSEPEQVDTLECVIDDFLVIDICFLHETNNMLILSKSHDHNINLHLLWIEVIGQEIKPVLTQINSKHLSSVDDHISCGKINHDSICYSGPGQFSVNAELFIADKLKFLVYEFSNVNQKQAEKFNPELILNSIEIPEHISNKISNISEIDFSSDSDFDAFLQIGNLEYFGAELLKKDLEQYKYNLAKLKDCLDKKLEEFLSHIQPDDSQHTLKEKLKYLSSLETIYRYISYRRTIEAERNKCLRKMDKLSNSDIKDIQKIDIKAEEVAQIKQCVWYFSLITKHNVFLSFQNKSKSITKVMELKRSSKKSHYSQRFDNIEKKYIHFKDLFIDIIIKESGVEAKYPFESNQDLFRFMTTNVSKNTMDFVMIYFLLDIYGLEVFEIEVGQAIEEVEDFREYLAYWLVDYSYAEYQSLNIISENFNKCLECINHPYSNNIEYIGAILQSFHELSSVRNSKLLGSEFQIFLKEKFSIGSSGNINDLGYYRENDLTILIYNLCKYENYSQAYLILNSKQEDQYFNSAFFILAYSLIKNNRLIDLINYDLTEKQKELLYKLLENECLALKCFISPYLESKDSAKFIKFNDAIGKELFCDKLSELKANNDLLCELISNFSSKLNIHSSSSINLKNELLCAETQTQPQNDFHMNTIREETDESKSDRSERDVLILKSQSQKPSPTGEIYKLFKWLDESDKKLSSGFETKSRNLDKIYMDQDNIIHSEGSENFEIEYHEETKKTRVEIEAKQLFTTPSARNESMSYGHEAGQDTHEKVDCLLSSGSEHE